MPSAAEESASFFEARHKSGAADGTTERACHFDDAMLPFSVAALACYQPLKTQ